MDFQWLPHLISDDDDRTDVFEPASMPQPVEKPRELSANDLVRSVEDKPGGGGDVDAISGPAEN